MQTRSVWLRRTAGLPPLAEPLRHRRNEHRTSFLLLQYIATRQECHEIAQRFHHAQEVAQVLKSVTDRFPVAGPESRCEGGTLLFAAVHPIFLVTLKSLADQVLLVKGQDREWNRETAVGIVFVPRIAVRAFALTSLRESLEPASGLQNSACPRPLSQRPYGNADLVGWERLEPLREPWRLCVLDALRLLQAILPVLIGLKIRFHAPLRECLTCGLVIAQDPGRHPFEQHPIEGRRQPGMRLREQFERGAQINDRNVGGLNRQEHPVRIFVFLLAPARDVGAGAEEDVSMGNRIDRLAVEGGGGPLHRLEHESNRIALRPLPVFRLPNSSQQQVARQSDCPRIRVKRQERL